MNESALLGALMLNGDAFDQVAAIVTPDDSKAARHRLVFEGVTDLAGERAPLDGATVCEHLRAAGTLKDADGVAYLARLIEAAPGAANALRFARCIKEEFP